MYYKRARTIRLELRFLCSGSVRRANLARPAHLIGLDPRKILAHNVKLVFLTERYIRNRIRQAVRQDRERHKKTRPETSRFPRLEFFRDQYRSGTAKRTESILRRTDMQEAHSWLGPADVERVPIGELFNIPNFLSWPDGP